MGKYNSINDAVRAKIDKLVEEKGLDKKDYLYTADVASSLNQLASIMGGSGDSMTIADSLYDVLDSTDGAGGGSGGGDDGVVDRSVSVYSNSQITKIGAWAFYGCTNLEEVNCPEVTEIDEYAFQAYAKSGTYFQNKYTNVDFPKCETVRCYAFASATPITKVNLPKCTTIEWEAFQNCTSISIVNIPKCSTIGDQAFTNCVALETVILDTIESIGYQAFISCSSLVSVYLIGSSVGSCSMGSSVFNSTPMRGGNGLLYVPASLYSEYSLKNIVYASQLSSMTDEKLAELRGEA